MKISISWSGGKDACFALYHILQEGKHEVVSLHTTFNAANHRVGLHGIHESLIEAQAASLKIPLVKTYLPESQDHKAYEEVMWQLMEELKAQGVEAIVYGDIFLEDLKTYREQQLHRAGLKGLFPLWQRDTFVLAFDFLEAGFKTRICAADADLFAPKDLREMDKPWLEHLPQGVDPCGENGEFHTLVFDGPIFQKPIPVKAGEVSTHHYTYKVQTEDGVEERKKGFYFVDLDTRP